MDGYCDGGVFHWDAREKEWDGMNGCGGSAIWHCAQLYCRKDVVGCGCIVRAAKPEASRRMVLRIARAASSIAAQAAPSAISTYTISDIRITSRTLALNLALIPSYPYTG